jgi:nucleoside-diphosphate-sugar epimerase
MHASLATTSLLARTQAAWRKCSGIAERKNLDPTSGSPATWVARAAAGVFETAARWTARKTPPSLTRAALAVMLEGNPFDVRRARTVLGWEPRMSPEEGIDRMVEWARTEGVV